MKTPPKKSSELFFRNQILHSLAPNKVQFFKDGLLVVKDGTIEYCGEFSSYTKSLLKKKIIHRASDIIIPGLIDCHIHLPQMDCRNKFTGTLLPWLKNSIWPEEIKFKEPKVAQKISRMFFKELIVNGTTTAAVYLTIHKKSADIAFQEAKKSNLRLIMGKVMMDQNSLPDLTEETDISVKESIELCKKWHGKNKGLLAYAFTPRFAPTCSENLLKKAAAAAKKNDAYIQTHLSENIEEIAWVKKLFPKNKTYTEVYEKTNLLRKKTILAHCIHLSSQEIKTLEKHYSSAIYCPTSNEYLHSGRMPVEKMKKLKMGIGTDVGAGPTFSIFEVMRKDAQMQKRHSQSYKKLFYLATLGGAKALSLEKHIGNFEPQKEADFLVIKGAQQFKKVKDIVDYIVEKGRPSIIKKAYVRGKAV